MPLETRKVLLGHRNGDITTHYSAPELEELLGAANKVCEEKSGKSPALVMLKQKMRSVLGCNFLLYKRFIGAPGRIRTSDHLGRSQDARVIVLCNQLLAALVYAIPQFTYQSLAVH